MFPMERCMRTQIDESSIWVPHCRGTDNQSKQPHTMKAPRNFSVRRSARLLTQLQRQIKPDVLARAIAVRR